MNESTLLKLKVIVERAVRPVKATISRKKRLREELLAHLTGVYEDELARVGDETTALIQAAHRFGDPIELARSLQETVPTIDRFESLVDQTIAPRTGESVLRRACRFGIVAIVVFLCLTIPLTVLTILFWAKPEMLGKGLLGITIASLPGGALIFLATLHSNGLQNALFSASRRSLFKGGLLVLASCLIPVFLPLEIALMMLPFLSPADCIVVGASALKAFWPAFLLSPFAAVMLAKVISDEKRYVNEWATLQIE